MVDVGDRPATQREAHARGAIRMDASTLGLIQRGETPKGDLLAVARVAAIQAAKRTWELIPLCHPLPLSGICLLYTSPSPRDLSTSRMPSSA